MKLRLKTLSPVHVGDGNLLEPFDYIQENSELVVIDQARAFELALKNHSDFPDKYQQWLDETLIKLDSERDNKKQASLRASFNFKMFCLKFLNDRELADSLKTGAKKYSFPIPFGLQNKKQISTHLKDPENKPYIPGSSIKGAIRTALMWRAFGKLNDTEKNRLLSEVLNSRIFDERKGRDLDTQIENEIFNCGEKRRKNGQEIVSYENIQLDLLKFVTITDTIPNKLNTAIYPANLYLASKEAQTQTLAQECIDFNSTFDFEIKIKAKELIKIAAVAISGNQPTWLNFEKKFERLFGFKIVALNENELEQKVIDSIFSALSDFNKEVVAVEKKWIEQYAYYSKTFLPFYNNLSANTLIRIGWGSGYPSVTLFNVLAASATTKDSLLKIFMQFKIGIPRKTTPGTEISAPNLSKFPKSKRMVSEIDVADLFAPLGWCTILKEGEADFTVTIDSAKKNIKPTESTTEKTKISIEELLLNNSQKPLKAGGSIQAIVKGFVTPNLKVQLLHKDYTTLLDCRFPSGLSIDTLIEVGVQNIVKGVPIIKFQKKVM